MIFETKEQTEAGAKKEQQATAEYLGICLKGTYEKVGLLSPNLWYRSDDTLLTVASILAHYGILSTAKDAIAFFEKPYKWERDMKDLAEELCPSGASPAEGKDEDQG